jgi:hypothetical protein
MTRAKTELGLNQEMMILQFWAQGIDILQTFSEDQLRAVPSLKKAIEIASRLPHEIGWGDELNGGGQGSGKNQNRS